MQVRAIVFDYGGTLDGGVHWLERFADLHAGAGLNVSFDRLRAAFDYATQRAYDDPTVAGLGLEALIRYHVAHQFAHLAIADTAAAGIAEAFLRAARSGLEESRELLRRLHGRLALGVISNFYGNLGRILAEAGLAAFLSHVIDSGVEGIKKPAPEIFARAVERFGCRPHELLCVGDSFEHDIVGAHDAGLRTAWLTGPRERPCRRPECVDVRLRRLADLEEVLAAWERRPASAI